MQLIADRFVEDEHGLTFDLATGERVCVLIATAGGTTEQASWAERCAWFSALVHPAIAPLLDYGVIGESRRFEAWGAELSKGTAAAERQARASAQQLLAGTRRVPLGDATGTLFTRHGRVVVVPDAGAGRVADHSAHCEPAEGPTAAAVCGVVHEADRRLAPVLELLASQQSLPVPAVGVCVPEDGVEGTVRQVARAARLGGRVPVAAGRFDAACRALVRGRSLVLIATGGEPSGWWELLEASLETTAAAVRSHVVCFVGVRAARQVHTVTVERVPVAELMQSVCPSPHTTRQLRRIATAARRARGLRERFAQLLLGPDAGRVPARRDQRVGTGSRAAEELRVAENDTVDAASPRADVARAWPSPGEVRRLRTQLDAVRELLAAGRHRPGERLARQVMHAFARRGEWCLAVESAVLLGRGLQRRGRCEAALEVVTTARSWATRLRDLPSTRALALLQADLLVDQGRLMSAASLFEPLLAATLSDDEAAVADVVLAFSRCLVWQGRYNEAWQHVLLLDSDRRVDEPRAAVRLAMARCAVALGRDRVSEAVALSADARDRAQGLGDEPLLAAALETCVEVQLAAGDAAQALATAQRARPHARRAHDPLLAFRLRLLGAEASRRIGQRGPAVSLVARCGRLQRDALPGTVRARVELLRDLLDAPDPVAAAERRSTTMGLPALRRYAPPCSPSASAGTTTADDIVQLLQSCQVAQEDRAVLAAVCGRLRERLGAAGVAFVTTESAQIATLVGDGARPDLLLAQRVLTANQLVLPHDGPMRAEAGMPVRYAGQVIGALLATWMPTARWHAADVSVLLSTGATAAGPALAGLLAARAADRRSRSSELLGVSQAATEIRAAIERASGAPFAVLVEGESGSGKELVARLLHKLGPRRERPFCTLNCAALPDELVESELFGHARGAFTGAAVERRGVFEEAHGGTLFLDEIGELSARAQAKLLRAIQEGEIRRVGENTCRRVDVRLVTATNRDLRVEVAAGRFRSDLLYRLDVLRIAVPPLRERRDDIPLLAEHIWREATGRVGSQATLAPATVAALALHDWPGNIRELQNVLSALVVRCPKRGVVPPSAMPSTLHRTELVSSLRLDDARQTFDRDFVRAALVRTGGRRTRAARELGLSRQGLAKLMARLEIDGGAQQGARP